MLDCISSLIFVGLLFGACWAVDRFIKWVYGE
jgi:hypothetical protein